HYHHDHPNIHSFPTRRSSDLGLAYLGNGNPEKAISEFRRYLATHPKDFEVHYHLGIALGQHGDLQQALSEFRRSAAINPSFGPRSEEHTSELQSQSNLVCRLL